MNSEHTEGLLYFGKTATHYKKTQIILDTLQTSQTAGQPELIKLVVGATAYSIRSTIDL